MKVNILQKYYDSFIAQEDKQDFLIGLADYIRFILADEKLKEIVSEIQKSKEVLLAEKNNLEKIVDSETRVAKKEYLEMTGSLEAVDDISLADKVLYSQSHPKLVELERKIKEETETSVWGAWDRIISVYSGYSNSTLGDDLDIARYVPYANRIHNYLLRKLDENIEVASHNSRRVKTDKLTNSYSDEVQIKKIEIYKDERKYAVRINDNFKIKIANKKGSRQYWNYIYEIAKYEKSEVDSKKTASGVQSWFNSNMDNPIYSETGLMKTKIVEYGSDFLYPGHGIKIVPMSKKEFNAF